MATYDAGDARLKIFGDASLFKQKLQADLDKIKVEFDVKVGADTGKASTDLDAWRVREQRNAVELKVDVDTMEASAKLEALSRTLSRVSGSSGGGLGGAGGTLALNAGALAVGSLPAAATAIANVAASIQQLAGAGAALPGALSGIAAVVATTKVGLTGVSDAYKAVEKASDGSAKSIQAANDALGKLAPSAAEAVRTAGELKTQLSTALVIPTQQNLFDGLSVSARRLVNADLPIVQRGFANTASSLNQNAKQILASFGSDSSKSFLDRILGNTADAQSRLTGAIDPLVHAFGTLSAAGSDSLPRLADGVDRVTERFDRFITAADGDGRLDKWIDDGITGIDHLGDTVLNLGQSFGAITKAAGTGGLLSTLDSLSGRLSTFLNSDQGQSDLEKFFAEGREQLRQWEPIISNIAQTLPSVYQASKQWTDVLLPPLKDITGFLAQSPDLVQGVATAFVAWKTIDGVRSLTDSLGDKGGGGLLGKLALAVAMIDTISKWRAPDSPNAGPNFGGQATLAGEGALAGASVGGPVGAVIGGAAGAASAPILDHFNARGPAQNGVLPTAPNTSDVPTVGGIPIPGLIMPGHANGGILPGYSPGRDNMLVPMSGGEGVIIPTVTRKLGPAGIAAINRGALTRGYFNGGIVDPNGNPVTPGAAPGPGGFVPGAGPAPIAPGGGPAASGILSSFVSGLGGPISNLVSLGQGFAGAANAGGSGNIADRFASVPGLAGLIGSAASSDPKTSIAAWAQKTSEYLGQFAGKTVSSLGSILTPSLPYASDASAVFDFATGSGGPLAALAGSGSSSSPDASLSSLLQQNGIQHLAADRSGVGAGTSQSGIKIGTGAGSGVGKGGAARWRPVVLKALQEVGPRYGITNIDGWANALLGQIQFESGGNAGALNPKDSDGLPAIGLGQFKAATFAAHNITGGSINDGRAQIYAMIDYVAQRYGQNSAGIPNYINQGHGYAKGGVLPGFSPGRDNMLVPLSGGEGIIVPDVTRKLGPDGIAAINHGALTHGFAPGGVVPLPNGVVLPPRPAPNVPNFQTPQAKQITTTRQAPTPGPVLTPAPPAPAGPTALPAPAAPPPPANPSGNQNSAQAGFAPGVGPSAISAAPSGDGLNHNLSAINTGISSAAQAIGQAASTAIGVAGSSGFSPGAGAIGPYVAGAIQEGGKVVSDLVNVGSSFLVGSVPGVLQQGPAQGGTAYAAQNVPNTATDNRRNYNIQAGYRPADLIDAIQLKDAQDLQAELARF